MRVILSPTVRSLFVVSLISAAACGGDGASVADGTPGAAGKAGSAAGGAAGKAGVGQAGSTAAGTGGSAGTSAAGAAGTTAGGSAGQGTAGTTAAGSAGTSAAGAAGGGQAGSAAAGNAGTSAGGAAAGGNAAAGASGEAGSSSGGAGGGVGCDIGGKSCGANEYCRPKDGTCGVSGTCEAMPKDCPIGCSLEGICGCDGNTYCNTCAAAAVGVGVSPDPGKCGTDNTCGPLIAKPCGKGTYCDYEESDACGKSGEGVCKPVPSACPKDIAPVCGCDGKTYQNACLASVAGISVAADGACEKGTVCNGNADCTALQYCQLDKACGAPGTCADKPVLCTKELSPVCACDGKTYDNACLARQQGASVDGRSSDADACQPPVSVVCGGKGGKLCGAKEYCDYPTALCGAADDTGVCTPRPTLCTKKLAPVCGCDGQTYDNDCIARQSGVDAATPGACATPKKACGPTGSDALVCGKGEYCKYASAEDACGYQTKGTCETIPPACTAVCDKPSLCGCDGKFYCGECVAAAAGTSPAPASVCQGTQPKVCKTTADCGLKLSFCKFTEADVCGKVSTGVCETRPKACPPVCNLVGVCACDGKRYCSECDAEANGVSPAPDALCAGGPSPI